MTRPAMADNPISGEQIGRCFSIARVYAINWRKAGEDPADHPLFGVPLGGIEERSKVDDVPFFQRALDRQTDGEENQSIADCAAIPLPLNYTGTAPLHPTEYPYVNNLWNRLEAQNDPRIEILDPEAQTPAGVARTRGLWHGITHREYAGRGAGALAGAGLFGGYQIWKSRVADIALRTRLKGAGWPAMIGAMVGGLAAGQWTDGNHLCTSMRSTSVFGENADRLGEGAQQTFDFSANVCEDPLETIAGMGVWFGEYVIYDQGIRRIPFEIAMRARCGGSANTSTAWADFNAARITGWEQQSRAVRWTVGAAQSPVGAWYAFKAAYQGAEAVAGEGPGAQLLTIPAVHAFQNSPQAIATGTDMVRWVLGHGGQYCSAPSDPEKGPAKVAWYTAFMAAAAAAAAKAKGRIGGMGQQAAQRLSQIGAQAAERVAQVEWEAGARMVTSGAAAILGGLATVTAGGATVGGGAGTVVAAACPVDGPVGEIVLGGATVAAAGATAAAGAFTLWSANEFRKASAEFVRSFF